MKKQKEYEHKQSQLIKQNSLTNPQVGVVSTVSLFLNHNVIFQKLFGSPYQKKNNFTYGQKQKIIDYLLYKNMNDTLELQKASKKKYFGKGEYLEPTNLKQQLRFTKSQLRDLQQRSEQLKLLKQQIRIRYVNETVYEFRRQRYVSMAYGSVIGSMLSLSRFKFYTSVRKIAVFLTFVHLFGQYSVYMNMDRMFDNLYPLFKQDIQARIQQAKSGKIDDDVEQLIKALNK